MFLIAIQAAFLLLGIFQKYLRRSDPAHLCMSLVAYAVYTLITGLRWRTGTDWAAYEGAFIKLTHQGRESLGSTFEPGYALLLEIISKTTESFSLFLLMQSTLISLLLYRSAKIARLPPVLFLGCVLLMQSQFWYPVRQQVAIAIVALLVTRFVFVNEKARIRSFWVLAPSASIHSSSLIVFPVLGFMLKIDRRLLIAVFGFAAIAIVLGADLFLSFFESRLQAYIYESNYEYDSSRNVLRAIERTFSVVLLLYLLKSNSGRLVTASQTKRLQLIILAGFVISIIALMSFPYLARLATFFNWLEALTLTLFLFNIHRLSIFQRLATLTLLCLASARFYGSIMSYIDLLDPYLFIFEPAYRSVY